MTKFLRRQQQKRERAFFQERRAERERFHAVGLNVILLTLLVFAGLSYLYYVNRTATGGFDIKGMESRIEVLQKDNKKLEVQAAQLQSLSTLEGANQSLQMVATTAIEYLPAVSSAVAVK